MLKQEVYSVAGEGPSMRDAVDDADSQMNEYLQMDGVDQQINITAVSTQSLYIDRHGIYPHTITIFYQYMESKPDVNADC